MADPKKLTPTECADALLAIERPLVVSHLRPDGDAIGSAVGLVRLLRALGKPAVFMCQDGVPERLSFLVADEEGEYSEGMIPIAIDVASQGQLGTLKDSLPPVALTIDHHAVSTPFSDNLTIPEASSAAEALLSVIDVLEDRGLVTLTADIAVPLYAAISSDTGCFCYSNATAKAHMRAARLLEMGIDAADINHRLFNTKTRERLRADGFIAKNLSTAADGRVAFAILTLEDMKELGLGAEDFECAIDIVRSLKGAEIAVFIRQLDEGQYKASLRSTGKNVAEIAAIFGGGGHIRAAGCTVAAHSADAAKDAIIPLCEDLFK